MPYAFTQDVPIDAAFYQRVIDGLGDEAPKGLIAHLAVERPEGGLRYSDVWSRRRTGTASPRSACTPWSTLCPANVSAQSFPPSPSETASGPAREDCLTQDRCNDVGRGPGAAGAAGS